jgi:PAS domain S-box-containing protein
VRTRPLPAGSVEAFKLLGVSALYSLTYWVVLLYFSPKGEASVFFLASGVALAALLIGGRRYFWSVWVGAILANTLSGNMLWAGIFMGFGSACAALVGAWLVQRDHAFDVSVPSMRNLLRVVLLGGFVGACVSASIGSIVLWLAGFVRSQDYLATLRWWWMGDALGVVLMTPLILVWWPSSANPITRPSVRYSAEAVLILAVTVIFGGIIFLDGGHWFEAPALQQALHEVALGYWIFLTITWAALRLGLRATTIALLLVVAMGITGAYQGTGIFATAAMSRRLNNYWFFEVILSLVGIGLATFLDANKKALLTLARSEANVSQELKNVMAALDRSTLVSTVDMHRRFTSVNDNYCKVSGYSRAELLGQSPLMLKSGQHSESFYPGLFQTVASGQIWRGEVCNRAKDGSLYWLQSTISPFFGLDGKLVMYVSIGADITARKLAEVKLAEREEIYRSIVTQANDGIALIDAQTQAFVEFNDIGCALLGYSREEFSQLGASDIQGELDEARVRRRVASIIEAGSASYDTVLRRKDGTPLNVHISSRVITVADRVCIVAIVTDLTERLAATRAQHEAQDFVRKIAAQVPGCIFQFKRHPDGRASMPYASEGLRALHGLSPQEVQEDFAKLLQSIHAEDRDAVMASMKTSALALSPLQIEYRVPGANGALRWLASNAVPQSAEDGSVLWHGFMADITRQKENELELVSYRLHLEELVRQKSTDLQGSVDLAHSALRALEQQKFVLDQHAIVTVCDVAGHITYGNDKFSQISGYTRAEFMGQDHRMVNSGHHPKGFFKAMYETLGRGEVWHAEVCNRAKDGHLYWVDTTVAAFAGDDGKPREYIAVRTDSTERKRAEATAQAASRAKSEFLANMSHEIRTPMNGIIGTVDVLRETELQPAQRRMLATIHDSSLSLLNILNDILDYSKIEAGKLSVESLPTDLSELAESVAQLMSVNSSNKSVEISVFVSPALPRWILSDPTRLRQVLLNLSGNAVKFTRGEPEQPGRVLLRVEPCTLAQGGPGLQLRVIDTGIGMTPAQVAQLFQPFTQGDVSTARTFGGTGLGLSISHRLVELMQGRISVRSVLGQGSEFTVELPLRACEPGRALPADPSLAGVQVLAVCGDALSVEIVKTYCEAAGASVSVFDDLALLREHLQQTAAQDSPTVVLLGLDVTGSDAELGLPKNMGVVRFVRRGGGQTFDHDFTVPVRPTLHRDLLHALARAGGRAGFCDDAGLLHRRHQSRHPAPSIEQALASDQLILLAEDNETNREVIQQQLRLLGYVAEVAPDGAAALALWRSGQQRRYALLLTDCHMPVMDGFALTAAIRQAEPRGTRLPIVAITANAMQGEAQRCIERGMDDYLSKPLRLNELGPMLSKWLPLAPELPQDSADASPQADMPTKFSIWDATTLAQLVGDNPALHRRLLEKFLLQAADQVASIGVAAAAGDIGSMGDVAHTLKSAARSVGALALGDLCQRLENTARAGDPPTFMALALGLPASLAAASDSIRRGLI